MKPMNTIAIGMLAASAATAQTSGTVSSRLQSQDEETSIHLRMRGVANNKTGTIAGLLDTNEHGILIGKVAARAKTPVKGLQLGIADVISPLGHTPSLEVSYAWKSDYGRGWFSYDHPIDGRNPLIFGEASLRVGKIPGKITVFGKYDITNNKMLAGELIWETGGYIKNGLQVFIGDIGTGRTPSIGLGYSFPLKK
ncbi:hypothetical protein GOV11_04395 [Candidatus Woesearchaeota archaeon]|nr:hypothetical protein [Candidatus Woesearchaeota archaeon]